MNKFFTKIVTASVGFAMAIGVGVAVNQNATEVNAATLTSTLTFSSAPTSGESYNASQNDAAMASYTWETDSSYISADNDGSYKSIHTGSGSYKCSYQKYTSSSFGEYLIKSVKFRAKSNGTNPSCAVTINGESVGSQSLTNSYQDLTIANSSEKQGGNLVINFTMNNAKKNIMVSYIQVVYETIGGTDPELSFSDEAINGEEGEDFSFTYSASNLTNDITWSPASNETDIIDYTVDTTNKSVNGTMKKAGSVTLTATSGSVSDSVVFNVAEHFTNRKYTVKNTYSVDEEGDTITGSTASYAQSYGTAKQATAGNSMTLTISGLTKKVAVSKLVLSMKSNSGQGSGSISVRIDDNDADFIAGTSSTVGTGFNNFGDNNDYSTEYKDVTWDGLTYVAKSSIEIKIYCIGTNSLYCESFDIFFEESDNTDVVTELTVSPSSWTGFDSQELYVDDFTVSVTTNGAAGTAVDYKFLGIGYMDGDNFVARNDHFTCGNPQVADTRLCWKANYPTTAGGSTYLYAYVTLNVSADTISNIAISGSMNKTSYYTTDNWDSFGLQIRAIFESGNEQYITGSAEISYYSNSGLTNEVATPADLGVGTNQTLFIKATYQGISNISIFEQVVSVSIEPGTQIDDPLTADQAIAIGSQYGNNGETQKEYYVRGVVISIETNQLDQEGKNKYATFDLEESNPDFNFTAYKITPNENCTNYTDLKVGAEVLLYCRIKNFKNVTIENGSVGELLSITYTAQSLTGVSLNKTSLLMGVGEEKTLTASPLPIGADLGTVVWSTLNNSVATVDQNGKVTAVAEGSATIVASAGGFETECAVTVSAKATMQYPGSELSGNMTETGNAATFGLDTNLFTVNADKCDNAAMPGLHSSGEIRLYRDTSGNGNGNEIITTINSDYRLSAVIINFNSNANFTELRNNNVAVIADENGIYKVTGTSFTIKNVGTDTVKVASVEIFYRSVTAQEKVEALNTQTELAYRYEKDGEGNFSYSDIVMRFGGQVSKDLWNELDTNEHNITGFGVILMDGGTVKNMTDVADAMAYMALSTVSKDLNEYLAIDYFVPVADMDEIIGSDDSNYFWNLRVSVDQSEMSKAYAAVAYIKLGDEYVLLNMANESVETLALDYMVSRGCDETTAGGSLQNIIDKAA